MWFLPVGSASITGPGCGRVLCLAQVELGARWFISQAVYDPSATAGLLAAYGDLCRAKGRAPKKVLLTFAPCGRRKTMSFIKWLGVSVPAEVEDEILRDAPVEVRGRAGHARSTPPSGDGRRWPFPPAAASCAESEGGIMAEYHLCPRKCKRGGETPPLPGLGTTIVVSVFCSWPLHPPLLRNLAHSLNVAVHFAAGSAHSVPIWTLVLALSFTGCVCLGVCGTGGGRKVPGEKPNIKAVQAASRAAVQTCVRLLGDSLQYILESTASSGVPIGINVESVSGYVC